MKVKNFKFFYLLKAILKSFPQLELILKITLLQLPKINDKTFLKGGKMYNLVYLIGRLTTRSETTETETGKKL